MTGWEALVRFRAAEDGKEYFAPLPPKQTNLEGCRILAYASIGDIEAGGISAELTIEKLVAPVPSLQSVICIGLNYKKHIAESSNAIPEDPAMWYKPARAISNPSSVIPIPKVCQDNFLDYEGELVVVIGKTARDVTEEEAANHILGYTVGNDLTARLFQHPKRSGGQYTFAKAFDNFAPLGPILLSPTLFNAQTARLKTRVNGRLVQDSPLDFVFSVNRIVSFLSQGTTLEAGTAIMTGTPSGIGWFQKPQYSLQDGDIVEVEIDQIGTLVNTMRFETIVA